MAIPGTPPADGRADRRTELFAIDAYRRGRAEVSTSTSTKGGCGYHAPSSQEAADSPDVGTLTVSDDTWDVARVARPGRGLARLAATSVSTPGGRNDRHAELDRERRH